MADSTTPVAGEKTRAQGKVTYGLGSLQELLMAMQGVPSPSIKTYRSIIGNPVVAFARMAANVPVKAADWSIDVSDDAPAGAEELIAEIFETDVRRLLVQDMLRAIDYGFHAHEVVWKFESDQWRPERFKPLLTDKVRVLQDEATGRFRGLRVDDVPLAPLYALLHTYDSEAGNWYGRSRCENIRPLIKAWNDIQTRVVAQASKVAGVTPILIHPNGVVEDVNNQERAASDVAQDILNSIAECKGVAMPNEIYSEVAMEALRRGANIKDVQAWQLSFMETQSGHLSDMVAGWRQIDVLLIRGWLVPERAITEGQFGTKAESETQADFVLSMADEILQEIARTINWHCVNKVLMVNYGVEAMNTVWLKPAKLADDVAAMIRSIIKSVLINPMALETYSNLVDVDSMFSVSGIPIREDAPDVEKRDSEALDRIVEQLFNRARGVPPQADPEE